MFSCTDLLSSDKQITKTILEVVSILPQRLECIESVQKIHEFHKMVKQQMSSDYQSELL